VSLATAQAAPGSAQHAGSSGGSWGKAVGIPGLPGLNTGKGAELSAVSCAAAGDCGAGGYYTGAHGHKQGFVVSERNGAWGKASEVPGLGSLNPGGNAEVVSVSCAAAGDCAAGGYYTGKQGDSAAFVVSERNGAWDKAIEVPGLKSLNAGRDAEVDSVSCAAAGDCAAGGYYTGKHGDTQAFVATESNGVWGGAIEVPGSARLSGGGQAAIDSMSCSAPGDCSAGGSYNAIDGIQALVVTERNGVWATAIEIPGSGQLNTGGDAVVNSVSCAAPGDCSAGGYYTEKSSFNQAAFVAIQINGHWRKAIEVPGSARLNVSGIAQVSSVSCAAPGDCTAGGYYSDAHLNVQAFVATESHGRWNSAIELPGSARLNAGGGAMIYSVSCTAPGDCGAGGFYTDAHTNHQAFVVTQSGGRWGAPIAVPGSARLNVGGEAAIDSVSCATPGHCSVGGSYATGYYESTGTFLSEAFAVTEK
jgi:hypothetical protein